jgi:hypothetical protein
MKNRFFVLIIFTVTSAVIYTGCKDTITGSQVDSVVIPSSNVSYKQYIQPVFNVHCVDCHGGSETDGAVLLNSWGEVHSTCIKFIFPGNANTSPFVFDIEALPGYPAMPPPGTPYGALNANQVNGIKVWINEGAKDN